MNASRSNRKITLALATLALGAFSVGVAIASVTSTVLHDTDPAGGPPDEVRLRIVRSAFVPSADQPVFNSGWHTHPGPVIVQVQEGRFKFFQGSCHPIVVGPGETFVETPELAVLATANKAVKWTASMVIPANKPPLTMVASPCEGDEDRDD